MLNVTMGTFAEATEEFIHATTKSRFGFPEEKFKAGRGANTNDELGVTKETITSLEQELVVAKKSEHTRMAVKASAAVI